MLISNGGDGSYCPHFTFNKKWIEEMEERSENGCDAEGFHYETITVPEECTIKSMDIEDCAD